MHSLLKKIGLGLVVLIVLAAGILAVSAYYFIAPVWPKNWGLFDGRYYFGPNAFFLDASLRNGEFPFWNPLAYSGMPFSADPQVSAMYPPHLLRSVLTPPFNPWATALSIHIAAALHVLFGAVGVYVLARSYRLSVVAGIAAAFAFIFGPYSIIYYTEFYVYALIGPWLPWLFWSTRQALNAFDTRRRIFYTALTALLFGLSTLAGFPQITLYFGISLTLYVLLDVLLNRSRPFKKNLLPSSAYGFAILAATAVLGGLVAAALLFPAYEFSKHSARVEASGLRMLAAPQNIEFVHLLKCLVIYPGNTWVPQGCRAVGIGSLLAVLLAFGHHRKRDVIVFVLLYLALTDLTIGPPFPLGSLLHAIDFLNLTVSPWRAGLIASFPLAMAVGFGIDAAGRRPESRIWRSIRFETVVILGVLMLVMLVVWLNDRPLFHPTVLVVLIPIATIAVMGLCTWRPLQRRGTIAVGLLIIAEMLVWSAEMLPRYVSGRIGDPSTAGFGEARDIWQGNRRTAHEQPNWHLWTLDAAMNGYNPLYVAATRQTLCGPLRERIYRGHLLDDEVLVDNARGHLFAKRSLWLAREWAAGPLPAKDAAFPPTTTVFLEASPRTGALPVPEIATKSVPRRAVSSNHTKVDLADRAAIEAALRRSENDETAFDLPQWDQDYVHSALYLGYIAVGPVDVTPIVRDETGYVHPLARVRAMPARGEQFLEFPLPDCTTATITVKWLAALSSRIEFTQAYVLKDLNDENNRIEILQRRANSLEVRVTDLPAPRILAHIDSHYPNWHAYLDGKEVPILRANDAFKAVAVPAGTHTVRFVYRPWSGYIGIALSLMTAAVLIALIVVTALKMRRRQPTASPANEV